MGISAYNAVYGHIGTEAIAAINIASTIESLAFVIFIGISDATGILVGNQIGAKDEPGAFETAGRSIRLAVLGAMLMGGVIFIISGPMLTLYNVAPEVKLFARSILTIQACLLWVRVSNMTLIVGVLRSGGDTRFSMFLDGVMMWIVGVPSALLGAFVFHLPVYWVYLMVMSEELLKFVLSLLRYRSKKWIHNVSQAV
jgi:Na+-driven multidrug efflux pump